MEPLPSPNGDIRWAMAKITVYHYRIFDSHAGAWIVARRPATRRAIDAAGGQILEGTEREVDIESLSDDGIVVRGPAEKQD